jgi:hypothetical protein
LSAQASATMFRVDKESAETQFGSTAKDIYREMRLRIPFRRKREQFIVCKVLGEFMDLESIFIKTCRRV